ncbi:MAG: response regulator [Candidatus Theseobacter exili]|nr:response regulator [Candidatus Theseobacter exili]
MKLKILVIDDEPHIVKILETRLRHIGYDVITGTNGVEALAKTREEKPNLVILDVMIPPPNGFQVCSTLKDDPECNQIPIILLTAKSTESDQFWGTESGADAYLTKPYNAEDLMNTVKSLIK